MSPRCHEAVNAINLDIPLNLIEHDTLFVAHAVQSKFKKTLKDKKKNGSVETYTGEHCAEKGWALGKNAAFLTSPPSINILINK